MKHRSAWRGWAALGIVTAASAAAWQFDVELPRGAQAEAVFRGAEPSDAYLAPYKKSPASSGEKVEPPAYELGVGIAYPMIGKEAVAMVSGDINGDGLDDVAVVTKRGFSGIQLVLFTQMPDGELLQGEGYPLGGSDAFNGGVEIGDLNNDGRLDIVVIHGHGMALFTAQSGGGFAVKEYSDLGFGRNLGLLDVDLDGYVDVVAQAMDMTTLITGYGDGQGGIRSTVALSGASVISDLETADVTGDGLPDLTMATSSGLEVLSLGESGFKPRLLYASVRDGAPTGVAVGDFDSDGRNDVAMTLSQNSPTQVWMYYQDGTGALRDAVALPTYDLPTDVLAADLDGDGRTDLAVTHTGWARRGFYLQGDEGLKPETLFQSVNNSFLVNRMVAADLNGDGCADLAYVDAATLEVRHGRNCHVAPAPSVRNDLDGDGLSDMLWRNDAKTDIAMWLMEGAERRVGQGYAVGTGWNIVAKGDMNGDGALDLVWSNGQDMQLWQRYGDGYQGLAMRSFPKGYRVVATGDVDGDGKADLLWRDAGNTHVSLWVMNGAEVQNGRAYGLSPAWRIAATGDLDGDRRMDLVLTNGTRMDLWRGARNLVWGPASMGGYPLGWTLTDSADMDGDGREDLLWRHADLGYFVYWRMVGPQRIYGREYRVDGAWQVLQAGDYTGDGKADIVWTNGVLMQMWGSSETDGFAGLEMPGYPRGWTIE